MPKSISFIVNPIAGTGNKTRLASKIKALFEPENIQYRIIYTEYAGHAAILARQEAENETEIAVACGGDGTMNEVAQGLAGTKTALGLLPLGSGNGLLRHLGISMNLEKALTMLLNPEFSYIDACKVNESYFFCTSGIGFDAYVAHLFSKAGSRGLKTYASIVLNSIRSYKPGYYTIQTGNTSMRERLFLFTAANANQFGNNFFIAPGAKTNDGLFDLTLLRPFPASYIPILLFRLMRGTLINDKYTTLIKTDKFSIKADSPAFIHRDGEVSLEAGLLAYSIENMKLKVCVPNRQ
ncbi:MAG: YegS/Rv2252/BmrU family lipid kinase [Bacteroidota bacterium]